MILETKNNNLGEIERRKKISGLGIKFQSELMRINSPAYFVLGLQFTPGHFMNAGRAPPPCVRPALNIQAKYTLYVYYW